MPEYTQQDIAFMRMAIAEARNCTSVESAYNVGAVITDGTQVLSTGYSRQFPGNTHAEQCALMALADKNISTANTTMYTTMEPCSTRLSGNVPCVKRVLNAKIARVFVGVAEPPNFVHCTGIEELRNHGVQVIVISELEDECKALNCHLAK
ncbi:hypothetical protein DL89DRAFT_305234 [Linderina pennispora]|uniref:CMP/dCMP-type deaminase domain-containing protein n=1 Tax=Linderina pennispora TaxID=61395 RepID=A0A1Y1VZP4_9FUNG|nr:uncharacterized protein DL89DRAFT_305234 [Linderina pennispora]ORX66731.1 hypothetical protein DL89DRAFT_305234 [Linderina pennispora]